MFAPTVRPGLAPPWWLEEALAHEATLGRTDGAARPLVEDMEVDVAIVGGGYTGLWTALALREREPSLSVAVLEQEVVGWGPSGRNGGFVHGYWTRMPSVRALLGDASALELLRAGARIVPGLRAFCEARGEDVWLGVDGYLKVSATPAQDVALDRLEAAAGALGVEEEAVPLGKAELDGRLRSPRLRRALFFRDCATVQPARLARALRRAALADGMRLHERTPVLRVERGSPSVLVTAGGRVRAAEVVLAVNAAAAAWKPVAGRMTNFSSYVVLTEPVPELLESVGWTGGEPVSDCRMFLHYFRTTRGGRVLMGTGSGPIGYGARLGARLSADGPSAGRAELGLRRLLPGLAGAGITHAWGGPIDVAADHLPFFGTVPGARIHYGAGYSGHGVGPSWLGGQILASLVLGSDDEWARLPLVRRRARRLPPEPVRFLGGALVQAAALACEEAEEQGRRASPLARAVAAVPRLVGLPIGIR